LLHKVNFELFLSLGLFISAPGLSATVFFTPLPAKSRKIFAKKNQALLISKISRLGETCKRRLFVNEKANKAALCPP